MQRVLQIDAGQDGENIGLHEGHEHFKPVDRGDGHNRNRRHGGDGGKNQRAEDLMMNAPSDPTSDQLMELGLRVIPQE